MLLSHNNEVTKPRALNTFLDRLAELGIDKGLIKKKKLSSDLMNKEKGYQNVENTSDNTQKREDVGNQFLFPSYRGERRRGLIYFHSLQIVVYLTLFVIVFNKVFKTVSLLWFYC